MSAPQILIRPARLSDVPAMAALTASVFWDKPFTYVINPHRFKYPADYARANYQRSLARWLDVAGQSWVACCAAPAASNEKCENEGSDSGDGTIIGSIQFKRLGNGAGLRKQMQRKGRDETGLPMGLGVYLLGLLGWIYGLWVLIQQRILPDRSLDLAVNKIVNKDGSRTREQFNREFPERWDVFNLVVKKEWQGKGVGRRLMGPVMAVAEEEAVPVALASSPEGEALYRKLGFELLRRFEDQLVPDGENSGGWFMWRP